jgi:hypothetical protein
MIFMIEKAQFLCIRSVDQQGTFTYNEKRETGVYERGDPRRICTLLSQAQIEIDVWARPHTEPIEPLRHRGRTTGWNAREQMGCVQIYVGGGRHASHCVNKVEEHFRDSLTRALGICREIRFLLKRFVPSLIMICGNRT